MNRFPEEFERIDFSGASGHWRGGVHRRLPETAALSPEEFADCCEAVICGRADMLKDRPRIAAALCSGLFFKLYKLPGKVDQIKRRFRSGRAMHSLHAAQALKLAEIPTPEVCAVLEYRTSGYIQDLLVTAALPQSASTLDQCDECDGMFLSGKVIPVIVRMHQYGIAHGDLNLRNIYRDGEEIGLIDLDGTVITRHPLALALREKELARLVSGFCKKFPGGEIPVLLKLLVDSYQSISGVRCDFDRVAGRCDYLMTRSGCKR